jgi:hypothetical protein
MKERQRATPAANAVRLAVAGLILAGGALAMAGQAVADPVLPYPTPVPSGSDGAPPPAGEPVVVPVDAPVDAPAPPPVGPPTVPEIANPVYGSGKSGSGPLGSLRDIWHEVRDGNTGMDEPVAPFAPPPGAGPAPKLPPGYTSLTDPASSTPASPTGPNTGGPPLPPGYYPLNGPPPPGWSEPPPPDPAAPPTIVPVPPTP